jgi:hypothetical protein
MASSQDADVAAGASALAGFAAEQMVCNVGWRPLPRLMRQLERQASAATRVRCAADTCAH